MRYNCSVDELKAKISERINIEPQQQRLIYQGTPLEDVRLISDYSIAEGSIVHFIPKLVGKGFLNFSYNGVSSPLVINPGNTILEIKRALIQNLYPDIEERNLVIIAGDQVLDEDHRFYDSYDVKEKTLFVLNIERIEKITEAPFINLIISQNSEGFWEKNQEIMKIVNISEDNFIKNLPEDLKNQSENSRIWMTIIILKYIEFYLYDKKNLLEITCQRAEAWLASKSINYQIYLINLQRVLFE